ncbi:hypothetical protein EST38_g5903 [Candolleomyces aberdarensis]|uniref:Peptidase C14 caspase domain-containing protein n=1 Tax=Candolleomyces aberdarensis TaxID=2316362 RepID=A0A4Q2DIW2_9AGAR|nr:hypothetical protein EST38_g5903 [Candolleomyces aberdarensis]
MAHNPKQAVTIEVTPFMRMGHIQTDWLIISKEAEAIVKRWRAVVQAKSKAFDSPPVKPRPDPYDAALSALASFHAVTGTDSASMSAGGSRDFSGKSSHEEKESDEKALMVFEQQTWDWYQLQGPLDHTRLLFECQVRAQRGEDDAKRRLEVLDIFHKSRHQNAGEPTPDELNWRDLPEVAPDPQVRETWGPRLWALLIGNNNYPQSPLRGAVNDSLAWKSYLTGFLGVPESHITQIQDADRNTMVTALYDLRDNHNIKESDHVIFAYAGHGSRYDAQVHSFDDDISHRAGSIEALCPVNRGLPQRRSTPDISDREVLLILSEIHNQTKAEITVVLDCCHSGGGTRELGVDLRSRTLAPLVDPEVTQRMFVEADEHPRRRPSTLSVRSPAWASATVDIYQPVVLTACQDTELAWEENERGLFTSAVMRVLRSEKGRNLTCSGLIKAIVPLSHDQRPRFSGEDTILFEPNKTIIYDAPSKTSFSFFALIRRLLAFFSSLLW